MSNWDLDHDPMKRPLGCNGKYGNSGMVKHRRRGTKVCAKCKKSSSHYRKELKRGQPSPHRLKPCGTYAAAHRHLQNGEKLDFPCKVAYSEYRQKMYQQSAGKPRQRKLQPCGTVAAYGRHKRNGEEACDPCKAANSAYKVARRRTTKSILKMA